MPSASSSPQILELHQKSLPATLYLAKWIPSSARLVVLGAQPTGTGYIQLCELEDGELKLRGSAEPEFPLKSGTFDASSLADRRLATGNFKGQLHLWDLTTTPRTVAQVSAHNSIIHQIEGFGGQEAGFGSAELTTCSGDGCVKVWDMRQDGDPVAAFGPAAGEQVHDCWTVAFGNSYSDTERCVLAGYSNGSLKLFDLRAAALRWETNLGSGVCGVSFDRPDIEMNKFTAACLDSRLHVFDARTQHPTKGFASVTQLVPGGSTLWACAPVPSQRELCMVSSGDGGLRLFKYHYPDQRRVQLGDGKEMVGVAGTLEQLSESLISEQPVCSFYWNPEKEGLFCCTSLDQCVRVGLVTKMNIQ